MRPGERELRDEAITALALLDYKMQQHWPSYFGQYQRMSPDCQHLARANTNGVIWVLRTADDGRVAELSDSPSDRVSRLDFSADGARLRAAYASGKICLWDWRRQQVVCRLAPESYAGRFTPVMTLDGRSLIYSDSNLKMAVLDVDSGEKRPCAIPVGGRPLAISPAGDELALGQWDSSGMVRCWPRPPGMEPRNSTA